jgi:pimeloyl-ACP methyl ester carboxylesterase
MKVYFITGLAADSSVFKYIQPPPEHEVLYLDWIPPQKNESLVAYAMRLAENIDTTAAFCLVGLSFGGMLATEIAKKHPLARLILISSVPSSSHFPWYFRLAAHLKLHLLVPVALIKNAAIMKRLFTAETREDKMMLKNIIRNSDPVFIKWAMRAVLNWKNELVPAGIWHIHGSSDEVLPIRYTKPTHTIQKGGHLMVITKAAEINGLLKEALLH